MSTTPKQPWPSKPSRGAQKAILDRDPYCRCLGCESCDSPDSGLCHRRSKRIVVLGRKPHALCPACAAQHRHDTKGTTTA